MEDARAPPPRKLQNLDRNSLLASPTTALDVPGERFVLRQLGDFTQRYRTSFRVDWISERVPDTHYQPPPKPRELFM